MALTRKRVLVTGGAGFLGSHLCERLLAEGANVICVDNFFSGTRSNIEHLLDHKRFELMRHDVTFPLYIEVDEIYNLACPASPIHYQRDPVQTTKTSMLGALNMLVGNLMALRQTQVKRMLADPRSEALATRFAGQWLRLQDLDKIDPDALLYPYYDKTLAEEVEALTIALAALSEGKPLYRAN